MTLPIRVRCLIGKRTFSSATSNIPLDIHPEVKSALVHRRPIVALETALVTNGLPYPTNLEVPLALEDVVRSTGSIPATIGIIHGKVKIGMEKHELVTLAEKRGNPVKVSRRDIAAAIATKSDGGTTCSATMLLAALAGIKVFATGGLGGVHRGGENSLDISADLQELARTPIGLVSSGVKSILDIKRTLEYLETLGVPVISYGNSKEFPAFYSRHSGYTVPWNAEDPHTIAKIIHTQERLGMQNGALIAVPIPEEYEAVGLEIQTMVDQAVKESTLNGVDASGNDATPWLLDRIDQLTNGKSLVSNVALLKNSALVAGKVAQEYQRLVEKFHVPVETTLARPSSDLKIGTLDDLKRVNSGPADIVIIGSAVMDVTAQELSGSDSEFGNHSTVPGHVQISSGGVARNVAEAAHRVLHAKSSSLSSVLIAAIGNDVFGEMLTKELCDFGMRIDGLSKHEDQDSAVCNMVLDGKGALVGGVAAMDINEMLTTDTITPYLKRLTPNLVAVDGNLPPSTLKGVVTYCNDHTIQVLFEPTSVVKSVAILPAIASALESNHARTPIAFCTPNLLELDHLYNIAKSDRFELMDSPVWWSMIDHINLGSAFRMELEQLSRMPGSGNLESDKTLSFLVNNGVVQKAIQLLPFFQHLVIKCGSRGALVVMRIAPEEASTSVWRKEKSDPIRRRVVAARQNGSIVVVQHFPALPIPTLVKVTGAGDSFVGALLATLAENPAAFYHPDTLEKTMTIAQKAAVASLQSRAAVSPLLSVSS